MMKRIFAFLALFVSVFAKAQTGSLYVVSSVPAMKAYYGNANMIYVSSPKQFFELCTSCTADESTVFAGVSPRKWMRVSDSSVIASLNLKATKATTITINGVTHDLSANGSWTVSGGGTATDTSYLHYKDSVLTATKLDKSDSAIANRVTNETMARANADALKADKATTITINGTAQDLSANRSWTISGGSATDTANLHYRDSVLTAIKRNISDTALNSTSTLTRGKGQNLIDSTSKYYVSARVFYASKWGAVSDADLSMGSTTTGTNNTLVLQALLDSASNAPVHIIVDGKYSADSLRISSNTWLTILPGMGLCQRDSIRTSFIANKNRTVGTIIDSNIVIDGGGIINGRGHNNSGAEFRQYYGVLGWNSVLNFRGINQLLVKDLKLLNSRTIMSFVSNFNFVKFDNCTVDQSPSLPVSGGSLSYTLIHDGFKFIGPGSYIKVVNNSFHVDDDFVSICANDGFFPQDTTIIGLKYHDSYASYGTIKDYFIDNNELRSSSHGFRLITVSDSLYRGFIGNLRGIVNENMGTIDNYTPANTYYHGAVTSGYVESLKISKVDLKVIPNNATNTTYNTGLRVGTNIKNFQIDNVTYEGHTAITYPFFTQSTGSTIDYFYADNIRIKETNTPQSAFTFNGTVNGKWGIFGHTYFPSDPLFVGSDLSGAPRHSFVENAGGYLTIAGTSTTAGYTSFTTPNTNSTPLIASFFAPSAATGTTGTGPYFPFGVAAATNNSAVMQFTYTASGSANNFGSLGVYGSAGILNWFTNKVGIGTTSPAAGSILDISSTTAGVLFPRMTTTQRTAISLVSANDGLMVYDITLHKLFLNENGTWVQK